MNGFVASSNAALVGDDSYLETGFSVTAQRVGNSVHELLIFGRVDELALNRLPKSTIKIYEKKWGFF